MNLNEILLSDNVEEEIKNNLDYILDLIPEIRFMINFRQDNPNHHLDVWNHTLLALSLSENDLDIRLSLLLHDIGKPFSYQEDDKNIRHFKNHAIVSSKMSKIILNRLNYDSKYTNKICYLVKHHDSPISNKLIENDYEMALKLYKIQYCDALAHNPDTLEDRKKYFNLVKERLNRSNYV